MGAIPRPPNWPPLEGTLQGNYDYTLWPQELRSQVAGVRYAFSGEEQGVSFQRRQLASFIS